MLLSLLDRLLAGKISKTALAFGVVAYQQGDRRAGGRLMGIASAAAPRNAALQSYGAAAAANAGDHARALQLLERALRQDPDHSDFVLQAALAQRALGDETGAALRCAQAIERMSDRDPGYVLTNLLTQLRMPGPVYLEHLATIQGRLQPRTYVEIGVAAGASIVLAGPATRVIGIDPAPEIRCSLPPNTTVFRQTSDEFFAGHDLRQLLGGLPVDLAFIDGMHLFEFVLRDFINLEKHCDAGSTILLDDCWPLDRRTAARERTTQFWSGDVWRILPVLRKYRPDLRIRTIATAPAGLCVVRGLDPGSRVLSEKYADIVREFSALDYAGFDSNRDTYLSPCQNDLECVKEILA